MQNVGGMSLAELLAKSGGRDKDRSAAFAHLLNEKKQEPRAQSNNEPTEQVHVHGMKHVQAKAAHQSSSDEAGSEVANAEWDDLL